MSTSEPEKPKRRRRARPKGETEVTPPSEAPRPDDEVTPPSEAPRPQDEAEQQDETTQGASAADATSEIEPEAEDVEAEEAAADVVLEADDEAEGEAEPEPPAAPAPRRRARGERPVGPPPVVRAQAKYVRSSARKARLVCDHIRGKSVEDARAILAHTPRAIARDWTKLLESAVANAENNHELVGEDLYVKAVHADEGPTIRRFRPRAMGRATRIRKRTSHLTILLTPKE
jgi:large subunit ribosomal protein L22